MAFTITVEKSRPLINIANKTIVTYAAARSVTYSIGSDVNVFSQTGHGFVVGDVLRRASGSFAKALADSDEHAEVVGIVTQVLNANSFGMVSPGKKITGLSGLVDGRVYFLSDTSAGAYTDTPSATIGHVRKPLFVAISATEAILTNILGVINA